MKNHLLLLVLAFATSALQAQYRDDMYSLMYRDTTGYYNSILNTMQQRDGDYIIDIYLSEDIGNYESVPFGRMCYKISSVTHTVTDSLFVADTAWSPTFLARNPQGEGNIRTIFEYHEDCDSTFVRISHFPDNDLYANPEEDVVVPLCEGVTWEGRFGSLIDSSGDLIITYYKERIETSDQYIARIGLDGTLKQQALLTEDLTFDIGSLRMLKESPLQYYQWHGGDNFPYTNLDVYLIDSLFHRDTVTLNGILSKELVTPHPYDTIYNIYEYEYLTINNETEVIPVEGDDVLVAAQYTHDTNFYASTQDCGVAVAKYDLSTKQLKGYAVFNDFHWYGSTGYPMGLKMLEDGTVYFMYKEHGHPDESVNIVKMDTNLNVEWKRFCKTEHININPPLNPSIVFEDEAGEEKGVAWCGYACKDGNYDKIGWVLFFLNHDGPVNDLSELGIQVRPYTFYPNPTKTELHLQYSPDVQPTRIDIYDMQGRTVHSQHNNLKTLNMEGFARGSYILRVTLERGQTFSDKLVKE